MPISSGKQSEKRRFVLVTRIDSDDMFRKNMIELVQGYVPRIKQAYVCDKGLVLIHRKPSILRRARWALGRLLTKIKIK